MIKFKRSIKHEADYYYSKCDSDDCEITKAFIAGAEFARQYFDCRRKWILRGSTLKLTGDRGYLEPTMHVIGGEQLLDFGELKGDYRYTPTIEVVEWLNGR